MRSKLLLVALIATLTLSLTGCSSGSSSDTNSNTSSTAENSASNSRFSAETIEIPGANIDYSCIITDKTSGKQYLYTFSKVGYGAGATMVEIEAPLP